MPELQKAGFFTTPSGVLASRSMNQPDLFNVPTEGLGARLAPSGATVPGDTLQAVQDRLKANLQPHNQDPNAIQRLMQTLTKRGNQAFLANPVPHAFNLTDLAYNKYGAPTAAQGLFNAARVATGNVGSGSLAGQIAELSAQGAKSQYGNIFDELGLTGLPNSSATNLLASAYNATVAPASRAVASAANIPLIAAQRASNQAQRTVLNSVETGQRAAALQAENNAGLFGPQAAKNVNATFGTDAPNAVSKGAQAFAMPFAKFHLQTAPGSVLKTMATNPGRIVNTVSAEQDMNQAVNPTGPQYRSTVPGANAARMLADPLGYFGNLGGVMGMEGPYSPLQQLRNGPKGVANAVGNAVSKFTPGSQPGIDAAKVGLSAYNQMLNNGPQTDYSPLFNAAFGGYTKK